MITGHCSSDDEFLALAGGTLTANGLEAAQTHMDRCTSCRRLLVALSRATTNVPSDECSERAGEPQLDLPVGRGSSIGRYVVEGVLGAGAMGVVYSAHDPELDRTPVIAPSWRRVSWSSFCRHSITIRPMLARLLPKISPMRAMLRPSIR